MPELIGSLDDFEKAWKAFVWIEAFQYNHLPESGGLFDQDDALMENVTRIISVVRKVQKKNV